MGRPPAGNLPNGRRRPGARYRSTVQVGPADEGQVVQRPFEHRLVLDVQIAEAELRLFVGPCFLRMIPTATQFDVMVTERERYRGAPAIALDKVFEFSETEVAGCRTELHGFRQHLAGDAVR